MGFLSKLKKLLSNRNVNQAISRGLPSYKPLRADSNIYDPASGGVVGNTVSNYVRGTPQKKVTVSGSRMYAPPRKAPGAVAGPYGPARSMPAPPPAGGGGGSTGGGLSSLVGGGAGGGAGSLADIEPDVVDLPTWIFEGNTYNNYLDYLGAVNSSIDRELQGSLGQLEQGRTRARGESERGRSSLLQQVAEILSDLMKSEERGKQNIGGYYDSLGDLYQSSEGVHQDMFAKEVADERSRVEAEKARNLEEIDRSLNDYLAEVGTQEQGLYKQANTLRDKNFGSAADFRSQLAYNPTAKLRQVDPRVGSVQLSDTAALLQQLNQFLSPDNVRSRYRYGGQNSSNPIYQYLSP